MELQPRPTDGQPREPPEYQSLDDRRVTQDYYNMGVSEESLDEKGEVYENVEWNGSVLHLKKGSFNGFKTHKNENEFFVRKIHGVFMPRGTVWTECS